MLATMCIQPHVKGKLTPKKLLQFAWEQPEKKPTPPPLSKDEARKRFEALLAKGLDKT